MSGFSHGTRSQSCVCKMFSQGDALGGRGFALVFAQGESGAFAVEYL